ncbi:MAG: hypothetical protein ACTSR3_04330 [Candidatus Helarchaeota archaeon]
MIESIHIINKESGISLFHKNYTSNYFKNKELMFVGFLKAIEDLSMECKHETVQEIILNESKIIFFKNDFVIVLAITKKTNDSILIKKILEKIGNEFVKKYLSELEFFSGRVSDFDNFSEIIDEIIENPDELLTQQPKNSSFSLNPINILKKIGIL